MAASEQGERHLVVVFQICHAGEKPATHDKDALLVVGVSSQKLTLVAVYAGGEKRVILLWRTHFFAQRSYGTILPDGATSDGG